MGLTVFTEQEMVMQPPSTDPRDEQHLSRRGFLASTAVLAPAMLSGITEAHAADASGSPNSQGARTSGVALVTGSSRGIGAAIAKRLARDGYRVMINYVGNQESASAVVGDIEAAGAPALAHRADVSDAREVAGLFAATEKAFGGVDVVVSNAGIMRLSPFAKMSDEDFERMMNVNVRGGFYVLREAARRVRNGGRIITLSSTITQLRTPTYGPYAASKAAQELYANVLAKELEGRMISVNAVAPGVVNTPLFTDGKTEQQIQGFEQRTPHKRLGEPEDIANVVLMLCRSDGAWINGQVIFANGGIV
jgi:3-oxoacyl-[acyl-carrier protein] reductase